MTSVNKSILTQVLFKKFQHNYDWLTYSDLNKIIEKSFSIKNIENGKITMDYIKDVYSKIKNILDDVNQIKLDKMNKHEKDYYHFEKIVKSEIGDNLKPKSIPVTTFKTYNVLVDSKDRNVENWPNHNPFQFTMGASSIELFNTNQLENKSVYRSFFNVHSVTIKSIIIPYQEDILQHSYLLLIINELGNNLNGTNVFMNQAFGYLHQPKNKNGLIYYNFDESYETIKESGQTSHMTKIFSPRIDISRLTFRFTDPLGENILFENNAQNSKSINILFQVTCLRKELDTNTILRPN